MSKVDYDLATKTYTIPDDITLKDLVKDLFELLEWKELSSNDREFHPTTINSCRVMHSMKLGKILPRMKELANE